MAKLDIAFLEKDVERQQALAQQALEEARKLGDKIAATGDDTTKATLTELKNAFLRISDGLVANATTTSVSGVVFLNRLGQKSN